MRRGQRDVLTYCEELSHCSIEFPIETAEYLLETCSFPVDSLDGVAEPLRHAIQPLAKYDRGVLGLRHFFTNSTTCAKNPRRVNA